MPSPPPPPDVGRATRDSIFADIEALPARRQIAIASMLGTRGSYKLGDKDFSFDFTGQSDADFMRASDAVSRQSAFSNAQTAIDLQNEFGSQFIAQGREQLRQSDPIGFALREAIGKRVSSEYNMGGAVSDADRRQVSQAVFANQARSGNAFGVAAGVDEVMAQGDYRRALEQQRLSNAGNFLAGTAPQAEFGQLRNAQAQAAPLAVGTFTAPMLNPNAGAQGQQFASQIYGTQMQGYAAQLQAEASRPNPWMQGLGIGIGALTSLATAGIGAGLFGGAAGAGAGLGKGLMGGWASPSMLPKPIA